MLKPSGLAVLAALVATIVITWRDRSWKQNLAILGNSIGGCLLVLVAVMLWLNLNQAIDSTIDLFGQINRYAMSSARDDLNDVMKLSIVALLIVFPIFVRGSAFRRDHHAGSTVAAPAIWFVSLWFIVEAAGVILQGQDVCIPLPRLGSALDATVCNAAAP